MLSGNPCSLGVAASGAALPLRCAWRPTRCITPKTISVSSFGVSLASSANPKPSPPQLTNSHALCITRSAPRSLQRNRLPPLRRRRHQARSVPTPETSRPTRISTHPPTERVMFLGSRLGARESGTTRGHSKVVARAFLATYVVKLPTSRLRGDRH